MPSSSARSGTRGACTARRARRKPQGGRARRRRGRHRWLSKQAKPCGRRSGLLRWPRVAPGMVVVAQVILQRIRTRSRSLVLRASAEEGDKPHPPAPSPTSERGSKRGEQTAEEDRWQQRKEEQTEGEA